MALRIRNEGAMKEAYDIAQQLNHVMDTVADLQRFQEEAEVLYHALLTDEKLLEKAREIARSLPTYPSYQEQIDGYLKEADILSEKAKRISRNFKTPQVISGWEFNSHSGGKNKAFSIPILEDLGYGKLEVNGKPLIKTEKVIDEKVWGLAIAQGKVDLEQAQASGAYVETNKTRRAAFKRAQEES